MHNWQALRTLQLLECHHKRLAEILRFQHEHPSAAVADTAVTTPSPAGTSGWNAAQQQGGEKAAAWSPDAQQQQQHQPPKLAGNTRLPPSRENSSSIASNLASARGIPSHPRRASPASPTLSSQQAGAKMTESPTKARTGESGLRGAQSHAAKDRSGRVSAPKQPWSPSNVSPTEITSQQVVPSGAANSTRQRGRGSITEEPFQRFYSTFGGLISKLSAPLAFAGLPLGTEASNQTDSTKRKSSADTRLDRHHAVSDRSSASTEPDVSRLFSKAALRAIRDNAGGGGGGGAGTGNTAESFYVVPTTGGTVSYAGILSRAEKEARRSSIDEGDDDFVDARETPSPELRQSMIGATTKTGRSATGQGTGPGQGIGANTTRGTDKITNLQNSKTVEELQVENQALKHLSDTLSKRLHMWEVNAQSSSIALQQSLRAIHYQNPSPDQQSAGSAATSPVAPLPVPGAPGTLGTPRPPSSASLTNHEQRIKELEDLVRTGEKELDHAGRENDKLRNVLGRYRERWEKLKEGAKTRRAESHATSQQQPQQRSPIRDELSTPSGAAAAAGGGDDGPASDQQSTNSKTRGEEEEETTTTKDDNEAGNGTPDQHAETDSKDVGLLLLS